MDLVGPNDVWMCEREEQLAFGHDAPTIGRVGPPVRSEDLHDALSLALLAPRVIKIAEIAAV
jgi:hypothetical protein